LSHQGPAANANLTAIKQPYHCGITLHQWPDCEHGLIYQVKQWPFFDSRFSKEKEEENPRTNC
jgi:hypothetical protein